MAELPPQTTRWLRGRPRGRDGRKHQQSWMPWRKRAMTLTAPTNRALSAHLCSSCTTSSVIHPIVWFAERSLLRVNFTRAGHAAYRKEHSRDSREMHGLARVTVRRGIFALFGRVWRWGRSIDIRCLRHMQMHRCITGTRTRPADGIHHEDAIAEECARWSSLGHPLDGRDTVRLAGLVIYRWYN